MHCPLDSFHAQLEVPGDWWGTGTVLADTISFNRSTSLWRNANYTPSGVGAGPNWHSAFASSCSPATVPVNGAVKCDKTGIVVAHAMFPSGGKFGRIDNGAICPMKKIRGAMTRSKPRCRKESHICDSKFPSLWRFHVTARWPQSAWDPVERYSSNSATGIYIYLVAKLCKWWLLLAVNCEDHSTSRKGTATSTTRQKQGCYVRLFSSKRPQHHFKHH